jgi:hypothetical protein
MDGSLEGKVKDRQLISQMAYLLACWMDGGKEERQIGEPY